MDHARRTLLCMLLYVVLIGVAPSSEATMQGRRSHRPGATRSNRVLPEDDIVKVPFSVRGGPLRLKMKLAILPPLYAIYLRGRAHPIEIDDLNKLRGYVQINTPQQALAFVRLRTSPRTYLNFARTEGGLRVEVLSRDAVTANLMFGDRSLAQKVRKEPPGTWGVVAPPGTSAGHRYAGLLAKAVRTGQGFTIQRTLLAEELQGPYHEMEVRYLEKIVEWVGRDGQYVIKQRTIIPGGEEMSIPGDWEG